MTSAAAQMPAASLLTETTPLTSPTDVDALKATIASVQAENASLKEALTATQSRSFAITPGSPADKALEAIRGAYSAVVAAVQNVTDKVGSSLPPQLAAVWDKVLPIVAAAWRKVYAFAVEAWGKGSEFFVTVALPKAKEWSAMAVAWVREVAGKVMEYAKTTGGPKAAEIVGKAREGMMSATEKVVQKVKGTANEAVPIAAAA